MPDEISYDIHALANLIKKDENAVVAFYGGEPLLRPDMVKALISLLPAKKFVLQTNGFFIEKIENVINKFDVILLSIDGRREITNFYRSPQCYEKVMHALNFLKEKRYRGDIIARMAVSRYTDIYEDVTHLLKFFPYVHWQLDVIWSPLWGVEEFERWAEKNYLPGIEKLIFLWRKNLKKGKVLGIVPFLGILKRMIWGGDGLHCGAGKDAIAIATDGKILACPIAGEFEWNNIGDFNSFKKIEIGEPCKSCDVYAICGGRCLFFYKEKLWGKRGFHAVCNVTKHLIQNLEKVKDIVISNLPKIEKEMKYPPFNNTTEIIP